MRTGIWLMGVLCAACGGASIDDRVTGASGGSSAGSHAGGTAATDGSGGSGTAGSSVSAGGGPEDPCAGYANEEFDGKAVVIRVHNHTAHPLFLGDATGCTPVHFPVNLTGKVGSFPIPEAECGATCESLQTSTSTCPHPCYLASSTMIAAGGYHDVLWSGTVLRERDMPVDCYVAPEVALPTCVQRVPAKGTYSVTVDAWTSVSCFEAESCDCQLGESGSCFINGSGKASGKHHIAFAWFEMPQDSQVNVHFFGP